MPQPATLSQLRKQIVRSYIPLIDSVGIIKFKDELSSYGVVGFFKNANFLTGKLIYSDSQHNREGFLIVLNVERAFLVKYSKILNIDGFEFFYFNRKSNILTLESFGIGCIKSYSRKGVEPISKRILNLGSNKKSLKDFSKLMKIPEFKNIKYCGNRLSFSKKEFDMLENFNELANIYKREIIERQSLLNFDSNLSKSFVWRCRGIINNMFLNLQQIEKIIVV
ncbi:hypothetical protein EHQ23_09050 [Leptospira bourretii]|nr:hypothetical protein [Leptospira bourretii]TGK84833.1 hypothetical protein EHQ23_09050 [Leptospira bourretii]